MRTRIIAGLFAGLLATGVAQAAERDRWQLPLTVQTLDNGLTVIVSPDHSAPTVGVSVVYKVGMRSEPRNRTGFAHLFEHLMFEGTPNAPSGTFDQVITGGAGRNNGVHRYRLQRRLYRIEHDRDQHEPKSGDQHRGNVNNGLFGRKRDHYRERRQ